MHGSIRKRLHVSHSSLSINTSSSTQKPAAMDLDLSLSYGNIGPLVPVAGLRSMAS
jgi:hypothetical protein